MKSNTGLLTRLGRLFYSINYYGSIHTLSIDRWHKIHENGDFSQLVRFIPFRVEKVWSNVMNEYIREFGLNEDYRDYIELIRRLGIKQTECVQNRTPLNLAELAILQGEIEDMKNNRGMKFGELKSALSKKQGYHIPKDISVYEFYSILKTK